MEFIAKAQTIHGNKYDYSLVDYQNSKTPITLVCPIHGAFSIQPNSHLMGKGCRQCAILKNANAQRLTKEEFITKAKVIHGHKYDYSLVDYINNHTKVKIICPIHGVFEQKPNGHLLGYGCKQCGIITAQNKQRKPITQFIEESNKIHYGKYDYSKVEYINRTTPVCIICPKHGEFWQQPNHHLHNHGCPHCNQSRLESEIEHWLSEHHIEHIAQCKHKVFPWLKRQSLDFYLPQYHIAIECQGSQHYEPTSYTWGKDKKAMQKLVEKTQERDARKARLCKENGVDLIYYTDQRVPEEFPTFKDKKRLLEYIYRDKA